LMPESSCLILRIMK
jgi:hypothetical protein